MATGKKILSTDFEIFGKVQGVFFRKYTQKEATCLNLVGWCMNTEHDTVAGQLQGTEKSVKKMKEWLTKTGSPKSKILKAEFKEEKEITAMEFEYFEIRK